MTPCVKFVGWGWYNLWKHSPDYKSVVSAIPKEPQVNPSFGMTTKKISNGTFLQHTTHIAKWSLSVSMQIFWYFLFISRTCPETKAWLDWFQGWFHIHFHHKCAYMYSIRDSIFIDREAREIICLVVSVCPFVCVCVCLRWSSQRRSKWLRFQNRRALKMAARYAVDHAFNVEMLLTSLSQQCRKNFRLSTHSPYCVDIFKIGWGKNIGYWYRFKRIWDRFYHKVPILTDVLDKHAPVITKTIPPKYTIIEPWMTSMWAQNLGKWALKHKCPSVEHIPYIG